MFDDAPYGNGAPMHIPPFFRTELAAPCGSEGSIEMLQNFGNLVCTALLDPTDLITAGGRNALPLLMDFARKPTFLHDDSVASLDSLLDPARTAIAPHPFYVAGAADRADVVQFLKSLDDQPLP